MSASFLGPKSYEIIVDREKFDKELWEVLNKALSSTEGPPKEKHVRSAMIATWREKGCTSFWKVIRQFPLLRSHIVCWKACFVVHRSFRDGHTDVVKKSAAHIKLLSDIGKHWGHAVAGYAPLITAYVRVLMKRIAFAVKNPELPGNLNFEEKPFKVPTDIDYTFQLCVEMFEVQSSLLHLYSAVITNLDPSRGVSAQQIQCKLAPLIPAIQDSAILYDIVFKLMKALHAALPADTLSGHRERFNRQYHALRKYFLEASKMKYLQTLVKIPSLAPDPPSFLLPGQLIEEELAKQVQRIAQQDEEASLTSLVELAASQPPTASASASLTTPTDGMFDREFGDGGFPGQFDFSAASPPPAPKKDDRDALIEQLMREIVELKEQRSADHELIASLRERMLQLEAEINDYKQIAEDACNENLLLKRQIEDAQSENGAQSDAVEARAKAADEKFTKLREVYQKLRTEHISLLRTNGEISKKLLTTEKSVIDGERANKELEQKITSLTLDLDDVKIQVQDESAQMAVLRDELRRKETQSLQLEKVQRTLSDQLEAKEKEAPHTIVVQAVEEAKGLIKQVVEQLPTHANSGASCSPAFLVEQTKACMDVIDNATSAFSLYSNDPTTIGKAVSVLASFSHSLSDIMLQGAAASHMTSAEDGQSLIKASEAIGRDTIAFLDVVKCEKPGSGNIASAANTLQSTIRALERKAMDLTPPTVEEETTDTLGDVVDEEMSATAQAVEAAALRIQEMLKKSREDDSGVKLEVNERILDSCTGLMKAIKVLIARSKDLQIEIVGEGVGTATDANEFYKKNSRWSEGLISAAKQVGWGASMLVDAADKVVQRTGKFEELVVASHDIAASTAQLVAASRVKARPKSEKLKSLKSSSRAVSEATGQVVASATSGSQLQRKESENSLDYSKLSLTQAKRLEMESQVKALELEKELEEERTRLAELRKTHYHLAGASEGWEEQT